MNEDKSLKYIIISLFSIGLMLLNQTIVYEILIPDLCYYHENEMNLILELFYAANGGSNGHPEPTILNFFFSLILGGFIGFRIYKAISNNI